MTTIQLALASGAAVFGSAWFALADGPGPQTALVAVLICEAALVALAAVVARGLRV